MKQVRRYMEEAAPDIIIEVDSDHFVNFFNGVRDGTPVTEDAVFGLRAAAPALACNDSYFDERIMRWDPQEMRVL